MSLREDLKRLSEKAREYRDQTRLQLYLTHQDINEEWEDLERNWDRFKNRLQELLDAYRRFRGQQN